MENEPNIIGKVCGAKDKCVNGNIKQPYSNFGRRPHTPDGYNNNCKGCANARSRRNQIKIKENDKEQNNMRFSVPTKGFNDIIDISICKTKFIIIFNTK